MELSPIFMRRLNAAATLFWIAMIPISIATGWINSVTYVAALSLWALVSGHLSAWQSARTEVLQQRAADEDVPQMVTDRIVEQTVIESTRDEQTDA